MAAAAKRPIYPLSTTYHLLPSPHSLDPNGSLALLLHDRQLYDHLNRAVTNVDEITRKFKPIVSDLRVFTDKIARHPEKLGVRGAIERSPGIK